MKCHRCHGEITEAPSDGPDELLIRQLIHDRESCPGPVVDLRADRVGAGETTEADQ